MKKHPVPKFEDCYHEIKEQVEARSENRVLVFYQRDACGKLTGITSVAIIDTDYISVGFSYHNTKLDVYSKKFGRFIALQRAIELINKHNYHEPYTVEWIQYPNWQILNGLFIDLDAPSRSGLRPFHLLWPNQIKAISSVLEKRSLSTNPEEMFKIGDEI